MKYLPRKYRESQSDWFGKRGISWHITTAIRNSEGQPQMLTFVHIFQSCNQDSVTVLAIIDDVLKQLKTTMPDVNCVYFRQDNAGCYHSASTLLAIQQVANKYHITVKLDFSDPQGGKGSCDRKAATIKNHVRIYLNSGQDVETADQLKNAIESSGGVSGVRATLCDKLDIPKSAPIKWDGVSLINNIESASFQRTRLSESQKQNLTEVFQIGERTGHKADPSNVSKSMRKARNADGSFKFGAASYLTSQQVASFFSRLAAKRVAAADEPQDEETEHQEEMDMIQEQSIEELSKKVVEEISIQHPIMYDTHNICELVAYSKLSKFSVQMLRDMCNFYQLDILSINIKRKKPYLELLKNLVQGCSCNSVEQTLT